MEKMTFVLFGATGDLAQRKLYPALYRLFMDDKLSPAISIIGLGRRDFSDGVYHQKIEQALRTYIKGSLEPSALQQFLSLFSYCRFDAMVSESYERLHSLIKRTEQERGLPENRLFYLSVAPGLVDTITSQLKASGISQTKGWKRLIIEKPFGTDLQSARELNAKLMKAFSEEEIFRIDHYLGKPMVQNLEFIKYVNPIFESLWDCNKIANVQITASETVGVEGRAGYYDKSGAIRDMAQNHLLQLVMMTALHLPEELTAKGIEERKREIAEALRPVREEDVPRQVVRGQYSRGEIQDTPVPGYTEEPDVPAGSRNDTYFAARLFIDTPSWKDTPFYIRTGKRLDRKLTRIVIEFINRLKDDDAFQPGGVEPNLLIFEINPNEQVSVQLNRKDRSTGRFEPALISLSENNGSSPDAYELLLHDAMRGDESFFAHWKEVELSWQWIQPILTAFEQDAVPLHLYPAGTDGPEAADDLLKEDGFHWWQSTL